MQDELTAHLGASPSVSQRLLIMPTVLAAFRLHMLGNKLLSDPENWSDPDQRALVTLSNLVRKNLAQLGMKAAAQAPQSLAGYLETRK